MSSYTIQCEAVQYTAVADTEKDDQLTTDAQWCLLRAGGGAIG